jgi:hypothetical protein
VSFVTYLTEIDFPDPETFVLLIGAGLPSYIAPLVASSAAYAASL